MMNLVFKHMPDNLATRRIVEGFLLFFAQGRWRMYDLLQVGRCPPRKRIG